MAPSLSSLRTALLTAGALGASIFALAAAAETTRIVLLNGRSIPLGAVAHQGENLVIITATETFNEGQTIPFEQADHVYGEEPPELKQATALLLMDKPKDAQKLLEPIVSHHRITASIPGNFWLEAARTLLVACAVARDTLKCTELGKEISDATPAPGNDPFVALGKALLLPTSAKVEDRDIALADLTTDARMPADVSAYASFYRANLLKQEKHPDQALEAYLTVPCLFPSGGLVLMAAAEIQAAELLNDPPRRAEALALLRSAARNAGDTVLLEEANKRLKSLQ